MSTYQCALKAVSSFSQLIAKHNPRILFITITPRLVPHLDSQLNPPQRDVKNLFTISETSGEWAVHYHRIQRAWCGQLPIFSTNSLEWDLSDISEKHLCSSQCSTCPSDYIITLVLKAIIKDGCSRFFFIHIWLLLYYWHFPTKLKAC